MVTTRTQPARSACLAGLADRIALALAALAVATGCDASMYDFRVYDDLTDSTWVHSGVTPGGVGEGDYGFAIAGGGQPPAAGALFLVAGRDTDGYGQVRYAADGTAEAAPISVYAVNTLELPNPLPHPAAMTGDPTSALVAVGLTNGGSIAAPDQATLGLIDATTGQTQALFPLVGGDIIRDMEFGLTDAAGSGARSLAMVRGNQLALIADIADPAGTTVPVCVHDREFGLSVAIADVDAAAPEDEIIFAVNNGSAPSAVHVVSGSLVSDAHAAAVPPDLAPCFDPDLTRQPLITIDAPGGETDFGKHIVAADFNGTGIPDLAISSTELVYVYLDVDLGAGLPDPILLQPPQGPGGFGDALAAGDITGDGADELVVGAPNAPAQGQASAGRAYLYQLVGSDFADPAVLGDAQPEANHVFGRAVAVVPFGDNDNIVVVGAQDEIYTYFRTPLSGDVRQFAR